MSADNDGPTPYHPASEPAQIRANDQQRDAVAQMVREALTDGRLDLTEIDGRIASVYEARTHGELAAIIADLETYTPPPIVIPPFATTSMSTISERKRLVAFLLCFLLGIIGIHRFYAGKIGSGITQVILGIVTLGIVSGVWALVDLIVIGVGHFKDGDGKVIRDWT